VSFSANARAIGATGVVVFLLGLLIFGVVLDRAEDLDRLADGPAARAAVADPAVADWLSNHKFDNVQVITFEGDKARVSFFDGQQAVLEAAVGPDGKVIAVQAFDADYVRAGPKEIQHWFTLVVATLIFLLLLATRPLLNLRNGDLLALAATASTIFILNERYFAWSVIVGSLLMAYLLGRCLWVSGHRAAPRGDFLVNFGAGRVRIARLIAGAAALLALIVTIPGGQVGDVAIASISGATNVLEGINPYGNVIEGIVHGDTYPIFAFVLYAPAALIWPVHDLFDNLDGALWIAGASLVAGAVAIFRAGRVAVDEEFGLRNATAWLIFPPVLVAASAGTNDLPTAALIAWAIATFAFAGRSTGWLSAAAWAKVVPVFILPLWLARFRGRELGRALIGPVVLTVLMLILVVALGGISAIGDMIDAIAFQAERGSQISLWVVLGAPALQLIAQALALALAAGATVAVWRMRDVAVSLARVCALAAAVLLAFQIGASYWSYAYLPWIYPLLVVALLWPRTAPAAPPSDQA
jgi:hypothetical protein